MVSLKQTIKHTTTTKDLFRIKEKILCESQAIGLPFPGPTASSDGLFTEYKEIPSPADYVLGMDKDTGHLWAQTKGQRCRKLHFSPLPDLRPTAQR